MVTSVLSRSIVLRLTPAMDSPGGELLRGKYGDYFRLLIFIFKLDLNRAFGLVV